MKKIVFSLTLLLFVFSLFSQAPANPKHSRDHYLKKSKIEKTEAWILLGGGAVCVLTGLLIPKGKQFQDSGFNFWGPSYKNDNIKGTFEGIGILFMLTSIKFFLGSSRNQRKANRATTINFNNQRILFPQKNTFVLRTQPSLTLKIGL
jgi:hypothetical protein